MYFTDKDKDNEDLAILAILKKYLTTYTTKVDNIRYFGLTTKKEMTLEDFAIIEEWCSKN